MAKEKVKKKEKSNPDRPEEINEAAFDVLMAGKGIGIFQNLTPEQLEELDTEELRALEPKSEIEEIIKYEGVSYKPIIGKNKRYSLSEKMLALVYLQSFEREYTDPKSGDLQILPRFTYVANLLGISKSTLWRIWQDREDIMKSDTVLHKEGLNIATSNFMTGLLKMSNQVANMDYSKLIDSGEPRDLQNFTKLLDVIVSKIRLIQNLSTENIAHRHKHEGSVAYILPDEKPIKPTNGKSLRK